ncbi:MAG: hypothetical protein A3F78_02655 [Burkholderiales bacterium RIFCSPLOWO2_12_FULL_61_40]|nr:MAG: hypothetical protein A3F78_02655 [Burkholderiales bacterium RIFCSPLOWO2_12_FULL_61_40]
MRTSMTIVPTLRSAAILCTVLFGSASFAQASPVPLGFSIAGAAPTLGAGYGQETDRVEADKASLLDVRFANTFSAQDNPLSEVGQSWTFELGTVDFRELNTGSGNAHKITSNETDGLGVSWLLSFTEPWVTDINLTAHITANAGPLGDAPVDYGVYWTDTPMNFGTGGQFRIRLNDISFADSHLGAQTQTATVTLLELPEAAPNNDLALAIPEPASLALVGVALAGLTVARRRKR